MATFLSSTERVARKDYLCDACRVIREAGVEQILASLNFYERKLVIKAQEEGWRVKAGSKYIDYRGVCDGAAYTLRMRPEIEDLVSKYNWWPEE